MQLDAIASAIGGRVRDARARLGLSRKNLASSAGVSERYLHQLETGTANASVGILVRVADALNLDFAFLVTGREDGVTGMEDARIRSRNQKYTRQSEIARRR